MLPSHLLSKWNAHILVNGIRPATMLLPFTPLLFDRNDGNDNSTPSSSSRKNTGLPPFKIKDREALLAEFTGIFGSQLLVSIYRTITDPTFPGWLAPITSDVFMSPRLQTTLENTVLLSLFWLTSYWTGSQLQQPMYSFRPANVFEFSLLQYVNVINQFIVAQLIYAYYNDAPAVGLEIPLISAFVGVVFSRLLYYRQLRL